GQGDGAEGHAGVRNVERKPPRGGLRSPLSPMRTRRVGAMRLRRAALVLLVLALGAGLAATRPVPPAPASPLAFRLADPRAGKEVDFASFKEKKAIAVVFLGTECPVNNDFLPVLAGLHRESAGKQVAFRGVNSNRQDTPGRVAEHARKHGVPFPVLKDPANKVADLLGARRTPEVFLLAPSGAVLYRGRI